MHIYNWFGINFTAVLISVVTSAAPPTLRLVTLVSTVAFVLCDKYIPLEATRFFMTVPCLNVSAAVDGRRTLYYCVHVHARVTRCRFASVFVI